MNFPQPSQPTRQKKKTTTDNDVKVRKGQEYRTEGSGDLEAPRATADGVEHC